MLRTARWAVVLSLTAVRIGSPQQIETPLAVFRGRVADSLGRAIAGVRITLSEGPHTARTDSAGEFVFRELGPALYHVTLQRLGFAPITGTARLARGDSIDLRFRMRAIPLQLDTVRTRAQPGVEAWSGFDARRAAGFGVFLTASDLEARPGSTLAEILRSRVSGLEITQFLTDQWAAVGTRIAQFKRGAGSGGNWPDHCYMQIIVDGIRVYEHNAANSMPPIDLTSYIPTDLAGVEIYRGAAETPLEFDATGAECGTIVLWTKKGPSSSNQAPRE